MSLFIEHLPTDNSLFFFLKGSGPPQVLPSSPPRPFPNLIVFLSFCFWRGGGPAGPSAGPRARHPRPRLARVARSHAHDHQENRRRSLKWPQVLHTLES